MRKLGAAWLSVVLISSAAVTVVIACQSDPGINGESVATVGSPTDIPTCAQVCGRLAALCGYAPVDCTDADGGGYCDLNMTDPNERLCIGYGSLDDAGNYDMTRSCQAAWDCVANEVPPDTSNDDASEQDDANTGDDDSGDQVDDAGVVDAGDHDVDGSVRDAASD